MGSISPTEGLAQAAPESPSGFAPGRAANGDQRSKAQDSPQISWQDVLKLLKEYQIRYDQRFLDLETALNHRDPTPPASPERRSGNAHHTNQSQPNTPAVRLAPWKAEEMGYFLPDASKHNHKPQLYYQDVYLFVERMRDVTHLKGQDTVRANIFSCLKGAALAWFTTELTTTEKDGLRNSSLEDGWFQVLIDRFKPRPHEALEKLMKMTYGLNDVKQGRNPRVFVQEFLRSARAAHIEKFSQLLLVWNHLDASLRRDIPEPSSNTTLTAFLQQLDKKYDIWRDLAAQEIKS
ncbi:uncharacterized protein KD926_007795 [Aspergillus affinis]|uniref:uncharacterized protein n=1 Tax=Aspergillus affinis TaxID=1070780 RepID=UPI0022FDF10F|nr:uncharacterized protein KD926_007795 [Aspergillus affinis]KAI9040714.1 hypothetical protein KD926_007795 [Aspergillus affinis]